MYRNVTISEEMAGQNGPQKGMWVTEAPGLLGLLSDIQCRRFMGVNRSIRFRTSTLGPALISTTDWDDSPHVSFKASQSWPGLTFAASR